MGLHVMRTGWGRKLLVGLLGALWLAGPAWAETALTAQARPAAPLPQAQGDPRPAIWLLADEDTRIYLFGTVHVLHPELRWRSAAFDRIVREAQELVLELSDEEMSTNAVDALAMMRMGKSIPILQRVSAARREGLARMLRELQIPEGSLDGLETWVPDMHLTRVPGATHWIVHEQPELVAREIEAELAR